MSDQVASVLNTRDDFRELAEHYETVSALEPVHPDPVATVPGPRVPPGMQEVLDADEVSRALTAADDWGEFLAHVLVDEAGAAAPDSTPARLRMAGEAAGHFLDHSDEMFALSVVDDLHDHLRVLRRLARRGVRRVRTGAKCQHYGCEGQLISPLGGGGDRSDDSLECDLDPAHRVPHTVWSRWPRARVQYVTIEHAARMAGTTVAGIKMRASRGKWRKIGTGRDVRYHVDDVREAAGVSSA